MADVDIRIPLIQSRVERIEVWHGSASIGAPNATNELRERRARRLESLRNYYEGTIEEPVLTTALPPYYATQPEADILWTLEYVESR